MPTAPARLPTGEVGGVPRLGDDQDDHVEAVMERAGIGSRGGWVGDERWEAFKRRLAGEAARLVRRRGPAIRRVADALVERGSLSGDEIEALLAS